MLSFSIIIIVFVLGFSVKNWPNSPFTSKDRKFLNILWAYHFLFGILYWIYVVYGPGGDAIGYWFEAKSNSLSKLLQMFAIFGPGTHGMYLLSFIPANLLGLSFLASSILFTLFGYIGIVYFYSLFIKNIEFNSKIGKYQIFPWIFFLPNLHFWSAGLGKDTISFMCIALFFYSMQKPSKNVIKILLALGLTYIVRPHISVFLVASFGIAFLLDGRLKAYQKALFTVVCILAFVVLFNKFMAFLKIEELNTETIDSYSSSSVNNLNTGGSGVDISSYPYPLKVLTFLFRPFFFDINNVLAIVASLENLLLVILSIKFLKVNPITVFRKGNYLVKGSFIFFVVGTLSFSLILGNLGIMLREKNMFIPALLFICLWGFSYSYKKKRLKT